MSTLYYCKGILFANISCVYMSHAGWDVKEKLMGETVSVVYEAVSSTPRKHFPIFLRIVIDNLGTTGLAHYKQK